MNVALIGKGIFTKLGTSISNHGPEILTAIGVTGVVTTTVLSVRATTKAVKLLESDKPLPEDTKINQMKHVAIRCWKCYIPTALAGTATIACIIASNRLSAKRMAVLASLYTLSKEGMEQYKETVKEELGQKAADKVSGAVAKKQMDEAGIPEETDIFPTSGGSSLCFDCMSGRYFLSSVDALRKAENEINSYILQSGYANLNEFYDIVGLEHCVIGSQVGWNLDRRLSLRFESKLTENQKPCLVVDYEIEPRFNYDTFQW